MKSLPSDWFVSPVTSIVPGMGFLGLGVWMLSIGATPTGVFFLLLAGLYVPFTFANAAHRRRLRGDRRPFSEQPIFRYESLIFGISGMAFLLIGLWSRRVGGDVIFSQVGAFLMAVGLGVVAVFSAVVQFLARKYARRARDEQSDSIR